MRIPTDHRSPLEKRPEPDTQIILGAFDYEVGYDVGNGVFFLNISMHASPIRYQLPFDRLAFGQFVRALAGALERVQNRESLLNGGQ